MEVKNRQRKACDLCYTRKIKCDGQEPRCSNCVIYATECTHMATSRKWKPKAQRNGHTKENDEIQSLQAQVQRLKAQLAERLAQDQVQDRTQNARQTMTAARFEEESVDGHDNVINSMRLPPLEQALPMLGVFLNNLNSLLPLFHADTLLGLVFECYALPPQHRDPVTWAAINVVLALANQYVPAGDSDGGARPRTDLTAEYLNKAQSVISTVMLGELRLLNLQTLVGMVMVLQSAHDLTPSLLMISATMRLVHKMGLHNRAASAHLDPVEKRQRARVFWLAYILDKGLSLRAQQPSVQLDDDIDLEFPSPLPDNEDDGGTAGIVITADGKARMNFFLARVQLANIEGGVYDCLYSTRALNRTPEERSMTRDSIVSALEEWRASIPPEFGAAVVASSTSNNPTHIAFFCILHSSSLACLTLINHAHAWDNQWVGGLRDHGRGAPSLLLPPGWEDLVHQARDFMILFGEAWSKGVWFRWMVSCPYVSAMVLLMANNLSNLRHDHIQLDSLLVDAALLWLNEVSNEIQKEEVQVLQNVCAEIVREVRRRRTEAITITRGSSLLSNLVDST
ncbi:fungal-specific transcription factor domain-protein [Lipomyces orientalis]|uniref:Fungal-specific transcription factor domain-protein n=1 Tax=Lipomyces orientalis TaxID=1233043 RepID=A0ACC3TRL0_9ASCO